MGGDNLVENFVRSGRRIEVDLTGIISGEKYLRVEYPNPSGLILDMGFYLGMGFLWGNHVDLLYRKSEQIVVERLAPAREGDVERIFSYRDRFNDKIMQAGEGVCDMSAFVQMYCFPFDGWNRGEEFLSFNLGGRGEASDFSLKFRAVEMALREGYISEIAERSRF